MPKIKSKQPAPIPDKVSYQDDVYMELENEFEEIRTCLGMYISTGGNRGVLHLMTEGVNNIVDEFVNPKSVMTKATIRFDENNQTFMIRDNGRGIPLESFESAVTKKHVSTKFLRKTARNKRTAGMNGIGMKLIMALSDFAHITSYRENYVQTIKIENDKVDVGPVEKQKKAGKHGLELFYAPSEKYLGAFYIECDMVMDYLRKLEYTMPDKLKIEFEGIDKENHVISRDYKYIGLAKNVEFLSDSLEFAPVTVSCETPRFDLEVSFSYDKTLDMWVSNTYSNMVVTYEGGYHDLAGQRAICEFFSRAAKQLDPSNKYEVTFEDCRKGLVYAVNCNHEDPAFEGQHKSKLDNKDVLDLGKKLIVDELQSFFSRNNALLRKIVTYLRQIAKIRMEASKIKGIPVKKSTTFLDDAEIKGLNNITTRDYNHYCELIITEGDSAGGAIGNVRNRLYQAIYAVFGVTDNIHGLSPEQVMTKSAYKNLVLAMGCGIGKTYDRNKLRWNKIIILTDADIDGNHITTLLLDFFWSFYPDLIYEGIIFKAIPPLYILNEQQLKRYYKGNRWIFDKREYYHIMNVIIMTHMRIAFGSFHMDRLGKEFDLDLPEISYHEVKKQEMQAWLEMNSEYMLELGSLVKRTACNPTILEYVVFYMSITDDEAILAKMIERQFPEVEYNMADHSLTGSYNKESVSLICDNLFVKVASRFQKVMSQNTDIEIDACNKSNDEAIFERMTIGEFLGLVDRRYQVGIDQRFKGLGEASAELLFLTTINPKMRHMIRISAYDKQKTNEMFDLLQQSSDAMREARRQILRDNPISYADIDN